MTGSLRRTMDVGRKLTILVASAVAALAAIPAVASATAWVSQAPVKTPFNSCANPGFNSIQSAINTPVTSVHVCKGTYVEQLQIERAVSVVGEAGLTTVKLPASPADSTTPCAVAGEQDVIGICGKGVETVKLAGLTIEGFWPEDTCKEQLYGVIVGGKANLVMNNSSVLGAGASPINGCQGGVGVRVGRSSTSQVGTAILTGITVSGYQKNGISIDGKESKATINKATVTTAPSALIAQNGIQVGRGAVGKITEATITGNECNLPSTCGPNSQTQTQSTGVLFFEEAKGSFVTKSKIAENDIGVYHLAQTEVNAPAASITANTLEGDRYESVVLDQGYALVNKDEMSKGNIGIQLIQYAGQAFGPRGTGSEDTVKEMSGFAVEGSSDNEPSDQFGSFTITKSKISGNPPAATVAGSVFTNNPTKLKIFVTPSDT